MKKIFMALLIALIYLPVANAKSTNTPEEGLIKVFSYDPSTETYVKTFDDGGSDDCVYMVHANGTITWTGNC